MRRRDVLRSLLAGAATLATAPILLHASPTHAGEASRFADGLRRHPWMLGWKSVRDETLGPTQVTWQGRLPEGLAGTLYRNGPAWMERDGFRYDHWFDGDGMVHGWRLGPDGVSHRARMVATPKFVREQKAGRFLYPTAGTTIKDALPIRNNDDLTTANTSVTMIDGRLFALYEAGSAFELDPDQLTTLGPVTWRDDLAALPFSAHPLRDADGSVWNFGSIAMMGGAGLLVWHIGADGSLIQAHMLETPLPGYLHAFAQTERHLVFVLMPFHMLDGEGAFFERMRFLPEQGCRIGVVSKHDLSQTRWLEAEFSAIYHFGDAFERNGHIVLRAVRHADLEDARSPMRAVMAGTVPEPSERAELVELHLDLHHRRARWQRCGVTDIEFPVFDPRTGANQPARLYAPTTQGPARAPCFNAVTALDVERGQRQTWRYGTDVLAEEHLFVPRPGSDRPDTGWLVGTLLDAAKGRCGIAVLDAQRVEDGPVAQAWLPYAFPLGFHGHFAPA